MDSDITDAVQTVGTVPNALPLPSPPLPTPPSFSPPLPSRITDQALDQLMGMAEDMGDELTTQNKQLDRINAKAEVHDKNISDFNRRIHKQLK